MNHRPWWRMSLSRNWNWPIAMSLTTEAEFPSLPIIPIPISASSIIPTSFPPSPIASTTSFISFFMSLTISAFYLGELRQNITDVALEIIRQYAASSSCWASSIRLICLPSTTTTNSLLLSMSLSIFSILEKGSLRSVGSLRILKCSFMRPAKYPIFYAV